MRLLPAVAAVVMLWMTAACASEGAESVPFSRLATAPEAYEGQVVKTEGVHIQNPDASFLVESIERNGQNVSISRPRIQVTPDVITSRRDCFSMGEVARLCRVEVLGVFGHAPGGHPHENDYNYQISTGTHNHTHTH